MALNDCNKMGLGFSILCHPSLFALSSASVDSFSIIFFVLLFVLFEINFVLLLVPPVVSILSSFVFISGSFFCEKTGRSFLPAIFGLFAFSEMYVCLTRWSRQTYKPTRWGSERVWPGGPTTLTIGWIVGFF